jgi:hypothetical protein
MAYILTQEDIDKLVEKGFDMNGVAAGTEAMEGEMEALGLNAQAAPAATPEPADQQLSGYQIARELLPEAGVEGAQAFNDFLQGGPMPMQTATVEPRVEPPASVPMSDAPSAAPSAAPAAAASPMMGLISAGMYGAPISADPFENLSKNQRMMLAFAAIKDAGAALQGGEGNAFNKTLEGFAARQDMERKRQAQVAQIKAQERVFQGLGAGSLPPNPTPADIDAYISSLTNMLVTQPSLANFVTQKIAQLTPLRDKLIAEQQAAVESTERANLLTPMVDRALSYINPEGATDEQGNPILNPDIANKLSRGYAAFSENIDYQDFMGNINTIKSQFTFKNMIDLKRKGVTFGALSTEELRQVADLIGTLDPANPLGSMRTLKRVRTMLNKDEGGGTGSLRFDPETGKLVEE